MCYKCRTDILIYTGNNFEPKKGERGNELGLKYE